MQRTWGAAISFLCVALVSACGGGGSGTSGTTVTGSVGGSGGAGGSAGDGGSTGVGGSTGGAVGSGGSSSSNGGTGGSAGSSAGGSDGSGGSSAGGSGGSSAGGSGGSSAGGSGGAPNSSDDFASFCEAHAEYICEWMTGCRTFTDCESGGPIDAVRNACETLPQAIADGHLVFDAELAASCLPDSLVCYGTPRDLTSVGGPCHGVVQAKAKIGDDCYRSFGWFDQPCAEGYCDMNDQCPGTCKAYVPDDAPCDGVCQPGSACVDNVCTKLADVGETCESFCLYGFPCIQGDDGNVCVRPRAVGEACDDRRPCSGGIACVDGVCGDKLELGEECTSHAQCPTATRCLPDTDSGTDTCQPLPGVGEACPTGECDDGSNVSCQDPDPSDDDWTYYCVELGGVDDPCAPYGCRSDLWCYYAEDDTEGVCLERGGSGDFCSMEGSGPFAGFLPCLSYPELYICIDEECTSPGGIGEPCVPDNLQSCAEGWCSAETSRCVAPAEEGEACNVNFTYGVACAEGLYCFCEGDDCIYDPLADRGECRPKKELDETCETSIECLSNSCPYEEEGSRCTEVVDQSACDAPYAPDPEG